MRFLVSPCQILFTLISWTNIFTLWILTQPNFVSQQTVFGSVKNACSCYLCPTQPVLSHNSSEQIHEVSNIMIDPGSQNKTNTWFSCCIPSFYCSTAMLCCCHHPLLLLCVLFSHLHYNVCQEDSQGVWGGGGAQGQGRRQRSLTPDHSWKASLRNC